MSFRGRKAEPGIQKPRSKFFLDSASYPGRQPLNDDPKEVPISGRTSLLTADWLKISASQAKNDTVASRSAVTSVHGKSRRRSKCSLSGHWDLGRYGQVAATIRPALILNSPAIGRLAYTQQKTGTIIFCTLLGRLRVRYSNVNNVTGGGNRGYPNCNPSALFAALSLAGHSKKKGRERSAFGARSAISR
jgi:hypothetical protein